MQKNAAAQIVAVMLALSQLLALGKERTMEHPTFYRTIQVDGLSIFYREAGPKDAPALLLLHGLPSSSAMFEPLFSRLSDRYHLVAPDGLRTQRLAGPEDISVHVRSHRRNDESLHRSARAIALHTLHAGLRRPRRVSHNLGSSRVGSRL